VEKRRGPPAATDRTRAGVTRIAFAPRRRISWNRLKGAGEGPARSLEREIEHRLEQSFEVFRQLRPASSLGSLK